MSDNAYKSGFVAVMGRPNVGKSTLVNVFLGQKVAAVSPRPQTTRRRQLGILTQPQAQIVFVDTPGVHTPRHKLGSDLNRMAQEALEDADVILFLVEANQPPTVEDQRLAGLIVDLRREAQTLLVLNKLDLLRPAELAARQTAYQALLPGATPAPVSALKADGCPALLALILERLPFGPAFYPEDQVTDLYEREIAADLIREAALQRLRDEVPHGIAVRVDEYTERSESMAYIQATLFLEREAHKPIVIGQGGAMLKQIGSTARKEIEKLTGRQIYLDLRVKVRENWRDDDTALKFFGFK